MRTDIIQYGESWRALELKRERDEAWRQLAEARKWAAAWKEAATMYRGSNNVLVDAMNEEKG